jgi:hypothetical protein
MLLQFGSDACVIRLVVVYSILQQHHLLLVLRSKTASACLRCVVCCDFLMGPVPYQQHGKGRIIL